MRYFERTQRIEEFTDEYVSRIAHPDDEMNIRRCNSREYLDEMMAMVKMRYIANTEDLLIMNINGYVLI